MCNRSNNSEPVQGSRPQQVTEWNSFFKFFLGKEKILFVLFTIVVAKKNRNTGYIDFKEIFFFHFH